MAMRVKLMISLILLLFQFSSAAVLAELLFETPAHWPVQIDPFGVCIADFNGDEVSDMATSNYQNYTVSILLGNGNGTFQPASNIPGISSPIGLQAGDIDNDSDIDLVLMAYSELATMLNNGDGTFQAPTSIVSSGYFQQMVLADVDLDNDSDLVVANYELDNDSVSVYLNQGNGLFASPNRYQVGPYQGGIAVGKLNNDPYPDLATTPYQDDSVSVLFNDGSGGFGTPTKYEVAGGAWLVKIDDLDNDADNDMAVSYRLTGDIRVFINDGTGAFAALGNFSSQSYATRLVTADLDDDNDNDLIVAGDSLVVLFNNGSGGFDSATGWWLGYESTSAAVGHLDNNNYIDIAALSKPYSYDEDPGYIAVLLSKGNGSFACPPIYDAITQSNSICKSDFDDDGDDDLAIASWWHGNNDSLLIFENDGSGQFSPQSGYQIGFKAWSIIPTDLDGDNVDDIVVGYSDTGATSISVLINNGSGVLAAPIDYTVQKRPRFIFSADLDDDTDNDLAVSNYTDSSISILINNGDGTFAAASNMPLATRPYHISGGYFNNDGIMDLVVVASSMDAIIVLTNNGDATFPSSDTHAVGDWPEYVHAADLDKDGDDDIIVSNYYSGDLSLLENNNFITFQTAVHYDVGDDPNYIVTGDLDGDSLTDIAVVNPASYNISVLLNNDNFSFAAAQFYSTLGDTPEGLCISDFNNDGNLDLAATNYSSGNFVLLLEWHDILMDVDDPWADNPMPGKFYLFQNYPNPFNPSTTIRYNLPVRAEVKISIHNLLGQQVREFNEGWRLAGDYRIVWDGTGDNGNSVATGVYFYQLQAGDIVEAKKMVLLK
jgi:hypothetical protein